MNLLSQLPAFCAYAALGCAAGLGLAALFRRDSVDDEWEEYQTRLELLRDAYGEGLLHGHLATIGGSFRRDEIRERATEWVDQQVSAAQEASWPR